MGDRHGGRFARRGRALNPPRPQVDAHRGVGFRHRAVVFRCRGVVGRICPRRNAPHGESLPTRRTGERICPARERSPRRKPPDTAHGRKDLPRAGTLPSAKAYRHGAPAKEFAPRRSAPHGEGLSTRRTSERIGPAQEHAPRRRPPDTAHGRKNLPRAGALPTAKASRHGARAKGFVPRRNAPLGEGLSTRRTSERVCPAQKRSPRRRPPDTAHERKDLPRGSSPSPHVPTNGGPPTTDGQPKNTPSAGSHPQRAAAAEFIHRKKIRLLHETQLFYGESHVDSRQIFPSFPSVGRCVARERAPRSAPHRRKDAPIRRNVPPRR